MAGFTEGVGAVALGGPPAGAGLGSGGLRFENPAPAEGGGLHALTDVAQRTLDGIGRFQASFDAALAPVSTGPQAGTKVPRGADGTGSDGAAAPGEAMDQVRLMMEQMEQASRVQAQLVQFVTASSVSSSLGKNLNMFLRGQ